MNIKKMYIWLTFASLCGASCFGSSDLNVADEKGIFPIHYAVANGNLSEVHRLLDAGADVNAKEVKKGRTPLYIAIEHDDLSLVHDLLLRGADPMIRNNKKYSSLDLWNKVKKDINPEEAAVIDALIYNKGGEQKKQDKTATSSIHYAVFKGDMSRVHELFNSGADVNAKEAKKGRTPLHIAMTKKDLGMIHDLLLLGADPMIRNNAQKTSIDLWKRVKKSIDPNEVIIIEKLLYKTKGAEQKDELGDAKKELMQKISSLYKKCPEFDRDLVVDGRSMSPKKAVEERINSIKKAAQLAEAKKYLAKLEKICANQLALNRIKKAALELKALIPQSQDRGKTEVKQAYRNLADYVDEVLERIKAKEQALYVVFQKTSLTLDGKPLDKKLQDEILSFKPSIKVPKMTELERDEKDIKVYNKSFTMTSDQKDKKVFDLLGIKDGERSSREILGVGDDATDRQIKSAYRKKSLKMHPDRFAVKVFENLKKGYTEDTFNKAFKMLTEAFDKLSK